MHRKMFQGRISLIRAWGQFGDLFGATSSIPSEREFRPQLRPEGETLWAFPAFLLLQGHVSWNLS
jgi:hypothetical protein